MFGRKQQPNPRPFRREMDARARRATVPPFIAQQRSKRWFSVALAAIGLFVGLMLTVRANPRLERDVVATMRLQRVRHPLAARMMHIVSWVGFRPQSLILPAAAVAGVWLAGFRREARYLCAAWAGSLLSWSTKRIVRRPRPSGEGISVVAASLRDSSFPSGHTVHYVAFWGFFAYLCATQLRGKLARIIPASIGAMVGLVGPSRVWLGHHWLTDVFGAYSLGTAWLATLIGLHRRNIGTDTPWDPLSQPPSSRLRRLLGLEHGRGRTRRRGNRS